MAALRTQAFAAEELSSFLIETYQTKHLPQMVNDFSQAGFTKELISKHPQKVFLMLLVAAYDRRPFTRAAGGYEYIWGMRGNKGGLPARFSSIGLSDPFQVKNLLQEEIRKRLKREMINHYPLDSADYVDYSKTLLDAANSSEIVFDLLLKAEDSNDIVNIYNVITHVHGIGETIAAKLIKYLLREIAITNIEPRYFPLSVVWPLVDEYHNKIAIEKLRKIGSDVVPLSMGLLLQKGDPFAIDALFYLNRYDPGMLDDFVSDVSQWSAYYKRQHAAPKPAAMTLPDRDKAIRLLEIIRDVCDDVKWITKEELMGLGQPNQVQSAAKRLYQTMATYASTGDIIGMYSYYHNCLGAKSGMEWDWLLEKIGRKSLKSEWERFQKVYHR
ncbi:MAG: hypothetical protein M0Z41_10640 [Peptococcaceae bacterium]|jgi:hypothetical protein|nr:hypothetical protein [Peptococcaceae bacterium]